MRLSSAVCSRSILPFAVANAAVAALAAPAMAQFAPGLHLYEPPSGKTWSTLVLADDGRTASGELYQSATSTSRGFTLQGDGVTHEFAEVSRVYDVSDNGAYTVGYSTRRAADGTSITLVSNTQPTASAIGAKISGDGQTVAGTSEFVLNGTINAASAWRWTATGGAVPLGPYQPNAAVTYVTDISRNGSTIVGWGSPFFGGGVYAWSWRAASGYSLLPDLPGAMFQSVEANAVNSDGSVIVGRGSTASGRSHAILWRNGSPTALPAITGSRSSVATGLSNDGSVLTGLLGSSLTGLPETAAIWTQSTNWVPALDYLRAQGLDVPSYYRSLSIQISGDGTTFSSLLFDARTSSRVLMVAVVPGPASLAPLGIIWFVRRRTRGRR